MSDKSQSPKSPADTRTKKWFKAFYRAALAIFIMLLLIIGFIFTPMGARLLLNSADTLLDPLHIDYQSGGLGSELHLARLEWSEGETQGILNNVKVSLDLHCIWKLAVCVESLSTTSVVVKIAEVKAGEPTETNTSVFTLPFPVSVKQLGIGNLSVSLENSLDLSWRQLQGELSFYKTLRVQSLKLQGTSITTYASESPNPEPPFDWTSWQYQPLKPLPISLPLYFDILDFNILDTQLLLAGQKPITIEAVRLKIKGDDKAIQVDEFYIEHSIGHISANGELLLDEKFSHLLTLDATVSGPKNIPVILALKSSGDIQTMKTQLNVSSAAAASDKQTEPRAFAALFTTKLSKVGLPLEANLNWNKLGWPLSDPTIESDIGSLKLTGDLNSLDVNLDSRISGENIPEIQFKLMALAKLNASDKAVLVKQFILDALGGEISSQGKLSLGKWIEWQGNTIIKHLDPSEYWPGLQADINGNLRSRINNSDGVWQGSIDNLDINGLWQNYPLSATGSMSFIQDTAIKIQNFTITNADNQLFVSGTVQQQELIDLDIRLDAPELANLYPKVSGALSLVGTVKGALQQPEVNYDLSANDISFSDIRIETLSGAGKLKWDEAKPLDLGFELSGIQGINNQVDTATVSLNGDANNHQLIISTTGETTALNLKVEGQLNDYSWQGKWLSGDIISSYANLNLVDEFDIQADWGQGKYAIGAHCWRQQESDLCINKAEFIDDVARWDFAIEEFNLLPIIRRFLPTLPVIQTGSRLTLTSSGSWEMQGLPSAEFNIELSPAKWTFTQQDNFSIDVQTLSLNGQLEAKDVRVEFSLMGAEIGNLSTRLQAQTVALEEVLNWPIDGDLIIADFNLAPFKALVPQLEVLQGLIKGQATVSGNLSAPSLNGNLYLVNGELKGESLPVWLSDIQQTIVLNGDHADFDGSYRLGKGAGELQGKLAWSPSLNGQVTITGNALEFDYQNIVKAKVTPDITLQFAENNVSVKGEVSLPYARVKVRDLPQGAVSVSKDVVLVEQQDVAEQKSQELSIDLLINIDPLQSNEVKLDAFGLTTDLQGKLRIQNNKADLLASGEVQLVNGKYQAYGQNLLIREGDILFNGSLEQPYLNIEAVRDPDLTEDDVVAGLRVEGVIESPTVTVFSEPELEQQQSLSYILTGRGLGDSSDDSQSTILTNVLLSLGLGKSENLISKAGNKLGFEDVYLDTSGQGDDTQLSLTGTISPGVQLRYGVGVFDSEPEVGIRYELFPKLYVEAVSGLERTLDIYYQFNIGEIKSEQAIED